MVTYMSEGGDPKLWSPICLREEILSYGHLYVRGRRSLVMVTYMSAGGNPKLWSRP
jgi:hypothetical protein